MLSLASQDSNSTDSEPLDTGDVTSQCFKVTLACCAREQRGQKNEDGVRGKRKEGVVEFDHVLLRMLLS